MAGIDRETESGVVALARHRQERVFGKYRGIVEEVDTEGRVRALVPAIGSETLPWAVAASPFAGTDHGLVLMPEVDDRVWIEFEGGDPTKPIWSGCFWGDRVEVPAAEPDVKIWRTQYCTRLDTRSFRHRDPCFTFIVKELSLVL